MNIFFYSGALKIDFLSSIGALLFISTLNLFININLVNLYRPG